MLQFKLALVNDSDAAGKIATSFAPASIAALNPYKKQQKVPTLISSLTFQWGEEENNNSHFYNGECLSIYLWPLSVWST